MRYWNRKVTWCWSWLTNYNDDSYSQGYGQIREDFRALIKDDDLMPYMSEHDFRYSNEGKAIGYTLYGFDIRYRKNFSTSQAINLELI